MKNYFAPMEGITTYIYRNAHHKFFPGIDKYYMPFISPGPNKVFTSREKNDTFPGHNEGVPVVPQILTNRAEDFLTVATRLKEYGYTELNLNLGCPSGTVVSKGKGSGFLQYPDELNRFLDTIFSCYEGKLSIKTRIGKDSPEEFEVLLDIFNQYPLEELIIHPRVQKDFYKNTTNQQVFAAALKNSKNAVCYNGDLFTTEDYEKVVNAYGPTLPLMFGRGLIANPALVQQLTGKGTLTASVLQEFHDTIFEGYLRIMSGERDALFKMKELWFYMIHMFSSPEKYAKKIKKAQTGAEYKAVVASLLRDKEVISQAGFCPPHIGR